MFQRCLSGAPTMLSSTSHMHCSLLEVKSLPVLPAGLEAWATACSSPFAPGGSAGPSGPAVSPSCPPLVMVQAQWRATSSIFSIYQSLAVSHWVSSNLDMDLRIWLMCLTTSGAETNHCVYSLRMASRCLIMVISPMTSGSGHMALGLDEFWLGPSLCMLWLTVRYL